MPQYQISNPDEYQYNCSVFNSKKTRQTADRLHISWDELHLTIYFHLQMTHISERQADTERDTY